MITILSLYYFGRRQERRFYYGLLLRFSRAQLFVGVSPTSGPILRAFSFAFLSFLAFSLVLLDTSVRDQLEARRPLRHCRMARPFPRAMSRSMVLSETIFALVCSRITLLLGRLAPFFGLKCRAQGAIHPVGHVFTA